MMINPWSRVAISAVIAAVSGPILHAQTPDTVAARVPSRVYAHETPYRILYDHIQDTLKLVDNRGNVLERWHRYKRNPQVLLVGVPPDRPIEVIVENANPLLYRYSVRVDMVQARNAQTCRVIGRSFAQRAFLAATGSAAGTGAPDLDISSALSTELLTTVGSPKGGAGNPFVGAKSLRMTETEARAESQRLAAAAERILNGSGRRLGTYADMLDTVAHYGTNSDSTLREMARHAENQPAASLMENLQIRFDRFHPGLSDPSRFVEILRTRGAIAALDLDSVDTGLANLTEAARLLREYDDGAAAALASGTTARALAALKAGVPLAKNRAFSAGPGAVSAAAGAQALLVTLRDLLIETWDAQFTAPPSGDLQRITLRLEPGSMWKDEPRIREGETPIYVEPRIGRSCEVSAGFAWLGAPELGVRDAKVVPGDDDLRTPPAVFLTIAPGPRSIAGATLGVGLGQYRRPDFFAGVTWRWLSPVLITGGGALQRHPLPATEEDSARIRYRMKFSWFGALTMSLNSSR